MIGWAEIPAGAKGQCTNTFSFTGTPGLVNYALNIPGSYTGNFDLQSHPSITSWSPCGGSTAILNMNTACNISPTHLPALIAVSYCSPSASSADTLKAHTNVYTGRPHQRQAYRQVCRSVAPLPLNGQGSIGLYARAADSQTIHGATKAIVRAAFYDQALVCEGWPRLIIHNVLLCRFDSNIDISFACHITCAADSVHALLHLWRTLDEWTAENRTADSQP